MTYILYNPLAGTGNCRSRAEEMAKRLKLDRPEMRDVTCTNVSVLVKNLASSDEIYLVGGDGTLNRFINAVDTTALAGHLVLSHRLRQRFHGGSGHLRGFAGGG